MTFGFPSLIVSSSWNKLPVDQLWSTIQWYLLSLTPYINKFSMSDFNYCSKIFYVFWKWFLVLINIEQPPVNLYNIPYTAIVISMHAFDDSYKQIKSKYNICIA